MWAQSLLLPMIPRHLAPYIRLSNAHCLPPSISRSRRAHPKNTRCGIIRKPERFDTTNPNLCSPYVVRACSSTPSQILPCHLRTMARSDACTPKPVLAHDGELAEPGNCNNRVASVMAPASATDLTSPHRDGLIRPSAFRFSSRIHPRNSIFVHKWKWLEVIASIGLRLLRWSHPRHSWRHRRQEKQLPLRIRWECPHVPCPLIRSKLPRQLWPALQARSLSQNAARRRLHLRFRINPGKHYDRTLTGIKVIALEYRLAPQYPFPAAVDDAVAVYKHVLKQYAPKKVGVYTTSAGAVLTAQMAV